MIFKKMGGRSLLSAWLMVSCLGFSATCSAGAPGKDEEQQNLPKWLVSEKLPRQVYRMREPATFNLADDGGCFWVPSEDIRRDRSAPEAALPYFSLIDQPRYLLSTAPYYKALARKLGAYYFAAGPGKCPGKLTPELQRRYPTQIDIRTTMDAAVFDRLSKAYGADRSWRSWTYRNPAGRIKCRLGLKIQGRDIKGGYAVVQSDRPYLPSHEDADAGACLVRITMASFGYVHALDLLADELVSTEMMKRVLIDAHGDLSKSRIKTHGLGLILNRDFWSVRDADNYQ